MRVDPFVDKGVPYYVHDYFGPGRHAKIVSTKAAKDLLKDGNKYRQEPPLTGDESVVAEVTDVRLAAAAGPGGRPAAGDDHHRKPCATASKLTRHAASRTTTARSPRSPSTAQRPK